MKSSEIVEAVKYDKTLEVDAHDSRLKMTKEDAYKDKEKRQ